MNSGSGFRLSREQAKPVENTNALARELKDKVAKRVSEYEPPAATATSAKKATLSTATYTLFFVAAHSHVLAEQFGVELNDDERGIRFLPVHRPWLSAHPLRSSELQFEADAYAKTIHCCSDYTTHMRLWILNVWNPHYAQIKGWHFDLFKALNGLDERNRRAIAWFLENPIWP